MLWEVSIRGCRHVELRGGQAARTEDRTRRKQAYITDLIDQMLKTGLMENIR